MTSFRNFKIDEILSLEIILRNLGYFLFLAVLLFIYIGNTHYSEKTIRKIDRMKHVLREERWQYMTAKNELMFNTKQTELAEKVKNTGLRELNNPPQKIVIEKGEY
ncbi:MAG: FtsL-like putative cell division protein [Chitinophagales bacterium]